MPLLGGCGYSSIDANEFVHSRLFHVPLGNWTDPLSMFKFNIERHIRGGRSGFLRCTRTNLPLAIFSPRISTVISPTSYYDTPAPSDTASDNARNGASITQETADDAELVRRFNAGDDAAFIDIVLRYRGRMTAVARSLIKNQWDAEEIAQDTFVRAYRGLANFRGDSSLSSWLHCITINLSHSRYWYFFRRGRHAAQSLDSAFNSETCMSCADILPSNELDPAHEAQIREFLDRVTSSMQQLNVSQRDILLQRYLHNRSYAEIADDLGISLGTVKSRIARARNVLRGMLGDSCDEFRSCAASCLR